ncbi:MAG: MFS transporter [Patescibacteria group bacterium]
MSKINNTIKLLILSDIFTVTGFGLIDPILAIFIKDNLIGGTLFTAGVASSLFLITKSIIQLAFSKHVDTHDDNDDLKWLIIGSIIIATVPFIYIFAHHIYAIFFAQIIHGIGSGLVYATWVGLWSTHMDKNKESFEWGLYSTSVNVGAAISSSLGAGLAQLFGFRITFIITGILSIIGSLILFKLKKHYRKNHNINAPIEIKKSKIKKINQTADGFF